MRATLLICQIVVGFGSLTGVPASHAAAPEPAMSLSPRLCAQLGGTLACQVAKPGGWSYRVDDKTFTSEATAYAYMLDLYGPKSVFALAYRWGKVSPRPDEPEQERSIETKSWKMYFRECSGQAKGASCDEFPRYVGYQRIRHIACPAGYQFSSDAASPYCLPANTGQEVAQRSARSPML